MTDTVATKAARDHLKAFVERIERLEEEKKALADDIASVYAEVKATGFDKRALRAIIKRRKEEPAERAEFDSILTTYMHALGMDLDRPLYHAVSAMGADVAARPELIEALKQLAPVTGELTLNMAGNPVRIFRDRDGVAHAEEITEPDPEPPVRPGKKLREKATVLTMVPKGDDPKGPKGGPSDKAIKDIADRAEREAARKRGEVLSDETEPEDVS